MLKQQCIMGFCALLWAIPAGAQSLPDELFEDGDEVYAGDEGSVDVAESRVYIIQPGDTLWDISRAFWEDPDEWPKMWSYNTYITNPHWIYPGNAIVFSPGTLVEPASMELEAETESAGDGYQVPSFTFSETELECGPDVRFTDNIPSSVYVTPGFLAQRGEVEFLGEVYGAKTGMTNLAERDLIYLSMDPDQPDFECGDVLAVVRRDRRVRHPEIRRLRYGRMYKVMAEVRVLHTEGNTAVIRTSYDAIKRGDRLTTLYPVRAELPVAAPRGDLEGMVVARLNQLARLSATGETIFIDRGRADGVRVGNAFYVIHRRDEGRDIHGYDTELPSQVAGRIIVTRVDEYTSTGVVVDAVTPIREGDHLSMSIE